MAVLLSPAQQSIIELDRLSKPKLSEIIVHQTFIPTSPLRKNHIQRFINMLHVRTNEARNVNARVEESISDSFIIVRKIHQLPPWKFINLELKFGASNDVPAVDKDLMRILKEFARDLEISERCSVSVSTARFIPDGSSHVRGAVDVSFALDPDFNSMNLV